MIPPGWRAWTRRHALLADAVLAVAVADFGIGAALYSPESDSHRLPAAATPFVVVAVLLVVFRRRWPLGVLAAVTVVGLLLLVLGQPGGLIGGPVLLACWTVAVSHPRRRALAAGGTVGAVYLVRSLAADGWQAFAAENLNFIFLILLVTAAGIAVRERRANLASLVERVDRAEATRESEAARRVAEERLRIARDLHDSLAHHMAVVNVQTGAAAHLLAADPTAAATALGHARTAAGQVLAELGTVLGVLRSTGDREPSEPAPSLDQLDALLQPLRAAGLEFRSTVSGRPRPLPPATDQTAYRVVQEAMTNAQKHARGSKVSLRIEYRPQSLAVEIMNPRADGEEAPGAADHAGGFGLAGMRERSAAVGGALEAGPLPDGGFRVFAELPAPDPVFEGAR